MIHILIVDDDVMSVKLTTFVLEDAGYRVSKVLEAQQVISAIERDMPDLILLDVHLQSASGYQICREVRRISSVPIVFLSGLGQVADRVKGLSVGGDDYIVKPFEPTELLARLDAVLRRYDGFRHSVAHEIKRANLLLDPVEHAVYFDHGGHVELTPIEFQILYVLIQNAGRVVSDTTLMERVWGESHKGRNLLTVYMYRLRAKLWPGGADMPVVTLRGRGYMFVDRTPPGDARAVGGEA